MTTDWMLAENSHDKIEQDDTVEVRYDEHDGKQDTTPGPENTVKGTVTKEIEGLGGGIFLKVESGVPIGSGRSFKLHNVPGGTVTGTPPHSSRTKRVGLNARVRVIDTE